jgi:uncharacterized integral membrane protein
MNNEVKTKDAKTSAIPVKYFEDQFDDEEVKYVFRRHPIVMRKGLIWGSIGLLVGPLYTLILTFTNIENPPTMTFFYLSFVVSIALSAMLFFPAWMSWFFSVFIVTNQRFIQITQHGFFHRNVSDLNLTLIQSINYDIAGIEQTLLGYGTITMQTYVGDLVMEHIHHPAKTQRKIIDILRGVGITPSTNPINVRAHPHES